MPRHTLSSKGPRKPKKKRESGSDLAVVLILAGFTAAVVVVIALVAIFGGRANAGSLTPGDQDVLTSRSETPVVSDPESRYEGSRAVMSGVEKAQGDTFEVA